MIFIVIVLWFLGLSFGASLLVLLFLYSADMFCEIIEYKAKEREEQERRRHDCRCCEYYRDGRCITQFEELCKERDYMIWFPKERE